MTQAQILITLKPINDGSYFKVRYNGNLNKELNDKNSPHTLEKEMVMQVRKGIEYDRVKDVIKAREIGNAPKKNAGLPWGEWDESLMDTNEDFMFIHHTNKKGEYNEYVRLYPSKSKSAKVETTYKLDGKEISWEELKALNILKDKFVQEKEEKPKKYQMMDYLTLKEQSEQGLTREEQEELKSLMKELILNCMTINVENIMEIM